MIHARRYPVVRGAALGTVAAVTLTLAGLTAYTRVEVRRAEQAFPPAGEFVQVDGVRLHYVDRGSGPPVVLLHGNAGFVQDYTLTIFDSLAARYRALAFDRPGHGYSGRPHPATGPRQQARLLHLALERLGIERPVLVGHSWGGSLALAYALDYPDHVSALALLAPTAYAEGFREPPVYRAVRTPIVGELLRHALLLPVGADALADGLANAYWPDRPIAAHLDAARALWLRPGAARATAWDAWTRARQQPGYSARYAEITVPVVIVAGEDDRTSNTDANARRLQRVLRRSELTVLPQTGHQLQHTRPGAALAAIDRAVFLAGAAAPGAAVD